MSETVGGVLVRIARTGLRKGVFEGRRGWLVAGVSAGMLALARYATHSRAPLGFAQELKPGEGLVIRTRPPGS